MYRLQVHTYLHTYKMSKNLMNFVFYPWRMEHTRAKMWDNIGKYAWNTCKDFESWIAPAHLQPAAAAQVSIRFAQESERDDFPFSCKIRICFFILFSLSLTGVKERERERAKNEGVGGWIRFGTFTPNKFKVEIWYFLYRVFYFCRFWDWKGLHRA